MIFRRRGFICTWVHLSTSHAPRIVAESGFGDFMYIYYSNRSYVVINVQGLDKYESNNIGDVQTDGKTITEVRTGEIYKCVR